MTKENRKKETALSLDKPVVFVVDMVNGFVHEGALSDKRIETIVPAIEKLIRDKGYPAVFVCDSHTGEAREFAAYPPHCVQGSHEAAVIDDLSPYARDVLPKNSTNTFMAPAFQRRLPELLETYRDFVITGCCTDLCVLQFALSLQSYLNENDDRNHRVIVPANAVETFHLDGTHEAEAWNAMALANMAANGIVVPERIED
ncbi:isochorismatase family cysteine hydrolase [uncultured Dubosiella sp.]|uniref:cysteine hydrolase family protein n=1 Tax=uncultured Dubosiella sp. TaxID=1937011 RepID=UPI00259AED17|nr:isochorismatase family cysteine hydrolase [uncultured Dubosiella sp.]